MTEPGLPQTPKSAPGSPNTTNQVLALDTLRLLYVEKNREDIALLRLLLQKSRIGDHQLDSTSSTEEALQWLKSREYHACLLNHQLGSETGLALIEFARSNHCHVPMLVLTNESEFALDVTAMLSGADNYLEKEELSARSLERAIRYAINNRLQVDSLRQQAEEDALTGLQNAGAFRKRLREAIARGQRNKKLVALLFIDMDGFKSVNDDHGHDLGDQVLKVIATRITQSVRETDTVGRIGGDEFAVILEGLYNPKDSERVCQAIIEAICAPFATSSGELALGASIGISLFPEHSSEPEKLIKYADQAMYKAKHSGGNSFRFFRPLT